MSSTPNLSKFGKVPSSGRRTTVVRCFWVELNPRCNQHMIKDWLGDTGVILDGWYPLSHGDAKLLEIPAIVEIALDAIPQKPYYQVSDKEPAFMSPPLLMKCLILISRCKKG